MTTEYVVDASALAKLFLDERDSEDVRDWWYSAVTKGIAMFAPALVRFEVGNLIRRNLGHLDAEDRGRVWREALAGIVFDDQAVAHAFSVPRLTFYDAVYVNLAAQRTATLVTFDDKMESVAISRKVTTFRPGS